MAVQEICLRGLEMREVKPGMKDLGWPGGEPERGKWQGSHTTRFGEINHYGYRVKN